MLVVFGITGDLAKVMTFRSLYRLEQRGLLNCPIVGVAGDDWTLEHLRTHARECIAGTGETPRRHRLRALRRASLLRQRRLHQRRHLRAPDAAVGDARSPVFYLEIPPSCLGP